MVLLLEYLVKISFVLISDSLADIADGFPGSQKHLLGMFQPDLLYIRGVGHTGLVFNKPVKIVFLKMEFPHQVLDGDVSVISLDIVGHFFKNDPVHGFSLFTGKEKFVFTAHDPKDAQQQTFTDVAGTGISLIEFLEQQRQTGFHLFTGARAGPEMEELLDVFCFHQGRLKEGDNLPGGDVFVHDFCKHIVCDAQEKDGGRAGQKIILMQAVFIDETQVAFGEYDLISQNTLAKLPFCNIGQFDIGMGMQLGHLSRFEGTLVAERLRRGTQAGMDDGVGSYVPAKREDPFITKQRMVFYFLDRAGIFRTDQTVSQFVFRREFLASLAGNILAKTAENGGIDSHGYLSFHVVVCVYHKGQKERCQRAGR